MYATVYEYRSDIVVFLFLLRYYICEGVLRWRGGGDGGNFPPSFHFQKSKIMLNVCKWTYFQNLND